MTDRAELKAALAALDAARGAIERALKAPVKRPVEAAPSDLPPPTEHRRLHRSGRPAKIASDPELRAFLEARVDRLTFPQLQDAVAAHFPPARRVGKSAIHDWWKRTRNRPDHPG